MIHQYHLITVLKRFPVLSPPYLSTISTMADRWTHATLTRAIPANPSAAHAAAPGAPAAGAAPGLGVFENNTRPGEAFAAMRIFSVNIVARAALIDDLPDADQLTMNALARPYIYVMAACAGYGILDDEISQAAFVYQTLTPDIPDVERADIAACNNGIIAAVRTLVRNVGGVLTMNAPRAAAEWDARAGGDGNPLMHCPGLQGRPDVLPDVGANLPGLDIAQARLFLAYVAERLAPQWKENVSGLHAVLYIAAAKRGEVTGPKLNAIARELRTSCNLTIPTNPGLYRTIYRYSGSKLTAGNARQVFDRWYGYIPQNALRLRLTLTQAAQSGLTQIVTIARALRIHPNYYWPKVAQLYPDEMATVAQVLRIIANNPYYGFNDDLTNIRATLYPNVAWMAKELLIRHSGEGTLRTYAGWIRTPQHVDIAERMLAAYATYQTVRFDEAASEANAQVVRDILTEVERNPALTQ